MLVSYLEDPPGLIMLSAGLGYVEEAGGGYMVVLVVAYPALKASPAHCFQVIMMREAGWKILTSCICTLPGSFFSPSLSSHPGKNRQVTGTKAGLERLSHSHRADPGGHAWVYMGRGLNPRRSV